jgi:hypothetical protein
MAEQTTTPQDELQILDDTLSNFESFLKGDGSTTPSLRENWIYLQVFATYGLWLPHTNADLQATLNLTAAEAATYSWFDGMVGSYGQIFDASTYFFSDVFNKMLDLGNGLKNYASDLAGPDSEFTLIAGLVKPPQGQEQDLPTALSLLEDLKTSAASNEALAGSVKDNLTSYKTKLVAAQGSVKAVRTTVDDDERTSQATIDKLTAGKDAAGSIAQLQDMLSADQDEYRHDVTVASTSVTYAWVMTPPPIPTGLIAAAVVAGVYGKRATDMLNTISQLTDQINKGLAELHTALAVQATSRLADNSLNSVIQHLDVAIEKVTTVQNAWVGVQAGLDAIAAKINASLTPTSTNEDQLKASRVVELYMKQGQEKWTSIQPAIDELMTNPVITVEPDATSIDDFVKKVQAEMDKAS